MGIVFQKCKSCLHFLNRQKPETNTHQPISLDKNADESTDYKINAQQISFAEKSSTSQSQIQDLNDCSMEQPKKVQQISSPEMPTSPSQDQRGGFLQQSDEQMTPASQKDRQLILSTMDAAELELIGEIQIPQLISELNDQEGYEDQQYPQEGMKAYFKNYIIQKRNITKMKFAFDCQANLQQFIEFSTGNSLIPDDILQDYSIHKLTDTISVARVKQLKYICFTPKEFQYFRYQKLEGNTITQVFKSVLFEDQEFQNPYQGERGNVILAGLKVTDHSTHLTVEAYAEIDFNVRLSYQMTKKVYKDRVLKLMNKLKTRLEYQE